LSIVPGVFAMNAAPPSPPIARVDLAALTEYCAYRGARLDEAPARWLGHRVAALLAEAHANVDDEGNIAPIVHGRLALERVLIDAAGEVFLVDAAGATAAISLQEEGERLAPRTDVHALGVMLGPLLPSWGDVELDEALATAAAPSASRRLITCVELEALFARGVDLDAGRRALSESVGACLEDRGVLAALSRPLPVPARVGVALVTAALVFAGGIAIADGWFR
jgi:hypothetical protein